MASGAPPTVTHDEAMVVSHTDQPKIILYWLDESRSQRILWLLEELKLDYKLEIFHRDKKTRLAPSELKKVHPLGKSPIISITPPESAEPIIIAESGLIIEYLLEHFGGNGTGQLLPKRWKEGQERKVCGETEEWMRYKYFLHYAEGSLMPLLFVNLITRHLRNGPVPFFIKPITSRIAAQMHSSYLDPNYETHFSFLEEQLRTAPSGGGYLCGPILTGADILMSFPMITAKSRSTILTEQKFPLLWKYIERLEQEPGYNRAIEKIVKLEGSFSANT